MAESRFTQASVYIEIDGQPVRVTGMGAYSELSAVLQRQSAAGVYVEIARVQARATLVGVYVEIEYHPTLDASLVSFFQVQAGKQDAFGTPADMAFALPVRFDYQDGNVEQLAQWDAGVWTGLSILEQVAQFATFTLSGTLFYELLPLLFDAGFDNMAPDGTGPYTYTGSAGPSSVGAPAAYTFRFGGNDANRAPTSMVQIRDAYLQELTLSFNFNVRAVQFTSKWFGAFVDDNDGDGYEPQAVALVSPLGMVNGLLATMGVQDAGDTGGAFDDLTNFDCALLEWTLAMDTGLRPAWAADQNALTYCGVRQEEPSVIFQPQVRTNLDTYALTLTKAQLRQFQELQLSFAATDRAFDLMMTGRWLPKLNAHDRNRTEVVMNPTFVAGTPAEQTTTPHYLSWSIESSWEHSA